MSERHAGVPLSKDEPGTPQELIGILESLGGQPIDASRHGFWPEGYSSPAPTAESGAPIVDDARLLSARRRGEIAILGGEPSPRAKELIDKALGRD